MSMIHHTLLPKEEMKMLRREYRIRLSVIALFFISIAVVIGILCLIPTYFYIQVQAKEASAHRVALEENRKASGADQIEKDLIRSQSIAERILVEGGTALYSSTILQVISHRSKDILLSSFTFSPTTTGTSTPIEVRVQGKAATREALLNFKKGLENDTSFSVVDLPLSDLAKSRDIGFTVKILSSIKK